MHPRNGRFPVAALRGVLGTLARLPGRVLAMVFAASLLGGCGGGGGLDPGTIGSGGTGASQATVAVGPIQGFGSVIVNGVRYDDSSASVSVDDGSSVARSALRIGMMVRVEGTSDSTAASGTAASVRVFSELKGVVADLGAGGFTVDGVTVRTSTATVLDGAASLANGDYVEVYGVVDTVAGAIAATRVERKLAGDYKRRGAVANWNAFARTFSLAGVTVDYSGLAALPSGFGNGVSVRAVGASRPGSGVWVASSVRLVESIPLASGGRAEIKGYVTAYRSVADFEVDGLGVDASSASFSGGTAAALAVGRRLEVKGAVQGATIVATRIEFEDGAGGSGSGDDDEFELKGFITGFVSSARFFVRNTEIDASGAGVRYEGGSSLSLANGRCVEVKGQLSAGANGSIVRATEIKFDNDCS